MEKDNFESSLQKIILQADENHIQTISRENVWRKVKTNRSSNKWWLYAAAVVLILSFTVAIFSIKNDKVEAPLAKNSKSANENLLKIVPQDTILPKSKPLQVAQKTMAKRLTIVDTLPTLVQEQQTELPLPLIKETIVAIAPKPVENSLTSNDKIIPQPEFTVQFKRGKPIETIVDKQIKTAAALKKLSFGRDTSTFVSTAAKSDYSFKIKF